MKTTYTVNMTCHSCEVLIGEAVKGIRGVKAVKSDHKRGKVEVDYDPPASQDEIKKAIESEGYTARAS